MKRKRLMLILSMMMGIFLVSTHTRFAVKLHADGDCGMYSGDGDDCYDTPEPWYEEPPAPPPPVYTPPPSSQPTQMCAFCKQGCTVGISCVGIGGYSPTDTCAQAQKGCMDNGCGGVDTEECFTQ